MNFKKSFLKIFVSALIILIPCTAKADIYEDHQIPDNIKTKIEKLVDEPSHLDGIDNFKRKPRQQRIEDNIEWYEKYGKVNTRYNQYCLDVENFGDQDNFIDYRIGFKNQENCDRSQRKFPIDDKLALYSEVNKKCKELAVPIYFKFRGEKILYFKDAKIKKCSKTTSALQKLPNGKFFIKPQTDNQGSNTVLLVKKGKKLNFKHVTKGKISLKKFLEATKNKNFFVQAYIEQHKDLKALNPTSLNTIRIITTKFNDEPQVLCAGLRMGKSSKTIVDNLSKGGCFAGIDIKTGKLQKYGFLKKAVRLRSTPNPR